MDIDMSNGLPLERRPSFDQRASDFPSDKELFPVEEVPDALIEYPDGGLRVSVRPWKQSIDLTSASIGMARRCRYVTSEPALVYGLC